jgi:hypothetical protein
MEPSEVLFGGVGGLQRQLTCVSAICRCVWRLGQEVPVTADDGEILAFPVVSCVPCEVVTIGGEVIIATDQYPASGGLKPGIEGSRTSLVRAEVNKVHRNGLSPSSDYLTALVGASVEYDDRFPFEVCLLQSETAEELLKPFCPLKGGDHNTGGDH